MEKKKRKRDRMDMYVDTEQWEKFRKVAKKRGMSRSMLLELFMRKFNEPEKGDAIERFMLAYAEVMKEDVKPK